MKCLYPISLGVASLSLVSCDGGGASSSSTSSSDVVENIEEAGRTLEEAAEELGDDALVEILSTATSTNASIVSSTTSSVQQVAASVQQSAADASTVTGVQGVQTADNHTITLNSPSSGEDFVEVNLNLFEGGGDYYSISFTLTGTGVVNSGRALSLVYETPELRSLNFYSESNDEILIATSFGGDSESGITYEDGVSYEVEQLVDVKNNNWVVRINDEEVYNDVFNAEDIDNLKFSFGALGVINSPSVSVKVTDLSIISYFE